MTDPRDLDIFARSLSGDWSSRVDLFKKFVWSNAKVRRLGVVYRQMDDFLHDCFTNVLRTGHSFDPEQSLGEWVVSVAAWTALERQRMRDIDAAGSTGRIRMSAGIEGDEAENRARMASYVPPSSGPNDSLMSRIAALVGEPQFTLLCQRAVENNTWENAAAAAGRPLNAIGPLMVRTVDRLSRFFGAPPPLNDDLEPVFSSMVQQEAKTTKSDPSKVKGRMISMQLDPTFYASTPELRKIGLNVPAEVRTMVLWEAARASAPPGEALRDHLAKCHYCADLLRALLLMQRAITSAPGMDFLLCPGGFALANTQDEAFAAFDKHLSECASCREERARLLGGPEEASGAEAGVGPRANFMTSPAQKIAAGAVALLLLIGGGYFALRHFRQPAVSEAPQAVESTATTVAPNPRYSDLAQRIPINDIKWYASVLPENRQLFGELVDQIQGGHLPEASMTASGFADKDPGVQMLYAMTRYQLSTTEDGYRGMLKAESMPPRNSFRCWALLQSALMVGDLQTVAREVDHLQNDPEYAVRAKTLLTSAQARK